MPASSEQIRQMATLIVKEQVLAGADHARFVGEQKLNEYIKILNTLFPDTRHDQMLGDMVKTVQKEGVGVMREGIAWTVQLQDVAR